MPVYINPDRKLILFCNVGRINVGADCHDQAACARVVIIRALHLGVIADGVGYFLNASVNHLTAVKVIGLKAVIRCRVVRRGEHAPGIGAYVTAFRHGKGQLRRGGHCVEQVYPDAMRGINLSSLPHQKARAPACGIIGTAPGIIGQNNGLFASQLKAVAFIGLNNIARVRLNPQAKYDCVEMRCSDCKPSAHACCSEFIDLEKTVIERLPVLRLHKPCDIGADLFAVDFNGGERIRKPGSGISAGFRFDMACSAGPRQACEWFPDVCWFEGSVSWSACMSSHCTFHAVGRARVGRVPLYDIFSLRTSGQAGSI